ncbi:MAG: hypothetical protein IKW10_05660 [Oscillospiraceae bacterium]|nr:hypothetical protein [Oscillospiraceae bacterium]
MKKNPHRLRRFLYEHRNFGIPNLMLYIVLGSAVVYLMTQFAGNYALYHLLRFDYHKILEGQVWRLFTYIFTYQATSSNFLLVAISLFCFYSLGSAVEHTFGTLRFNLFYLTGILLMDTFAMCCGGIPVEFMGVSIDVNDLGVYTTMSYYLHLSLLIAFATLYPDTHFLLFFIIPVKAWIFGLLDIILTLYGVYEMLFLHALSPMLPHSLFPLVAIANYFLFFGKDVSRLFPVSWRINASRLFRRKPKKQKSTGTIPFPTAGSYEATTATVKAPYMHRCTICGKTDVSDPNMEFRYCSKCNGYFCYCQEHISNHTHVE